ncbi:MAG TPA: hypothetical protein VEO19_10105 [Terriglobia bacterium]|nr:hypothetical protein [Terriglobia bacterium]
MDPQVIQRTRYVLRIRVRRAQTCPLALFPSACEHLLAWLESHPVLSSLVPRLKSPPAEAREQIEKIIADAPTSNPYYPYFSYSAASAEEHAALCLHVVRAVIRTAAMQPESRETALICLAEYLSGQLFDSAQEAVKALRDVPVDGTYEYLDEQIDTRNVVYSILLKYKQRSEWFHRSRLRAIADEGLEGAKGERSLARDLQEYVFSEHVEFIIEPRSSSGEADLMLREPCGRYLIIDAKYVPADATRSTIRDRIASGFHQVARYCEDFREPEGFLVSFIRSPKRISLELEESDGLSFLKLGGKAVYYLAVQISDEPSASKSGKADEVIIARGELVSPVPE